MDLAARCNLRSTTLKILHAHAFARSSNNAVCILTDVLERYVNLLSLTCAQYAQHAGRTSLNIHDAVAALREMGVDMAELREFVDGEGKDMRKYTVPNRDAQEMNALLHQGKKRDYSDAFLLKYRPLPSPAPSPPLDTEFYNLLNEFSPGRSMSPSSPPLPPSPISNPASEKNSAFPYDWDDTNLPPRKRARTSSRYPPHIPSFFPPFPNEEIVSEPLPQEPPSSAAVDALPAASGLVVSPTQHLSPIPEQTILPTALATGSDPPTAIQIDPAEPDFVPLVHSLPRATSDYFTSVPYDESSLAGLPLWHLPDLPFENTVNSSARQVTTQPELIKAFQALGADESKTSQPSTSLPSSIADRNRNQLLRKSNNPAKHKLALEMIKVSPARYTVADSMFSDIHPNLPRMPMVVVPTFPVAIDDKDPSKPKPPLPPPVPRPVAPAPPISGMTFLQGGRLSSLAKAVVSGPVHSRVTRLLPPPLQNRQGVDLLYGRPVPAPWNGSAALATGAAKAWDTSKAKVPKEAKSDKSNAQSTVGVPPLADAMLYATWDWTVKAPTDPLRRRGMTISSHVDGNAKGLSNGDSPMGPPPIPPPANSRGPKAPGAIRTSRSSTPATSHKSSTLGGGNQWANKPSSPQIDGPLPSASSDLQPAKPLWRLTLPKPPSHNSPVTTDLNEQHSQRDTIMIDVDPHHITIDDHV